LSFALCLLSFVFRPAPYPNSELSFCNESS